MAYINRTKVRQLSQLNDDTRLPERELALYGEVLYVGQGNSKPPVPVTCGGNKSTSHYYNTVEDLVNAKVLKSSVVETLGYYELGDKGGARYLIEEEGLYPWSIKLKNGLYANIHEPEKVNYKQFGAKLNGVDDDYPYMLLCHKYADSFRIYDKDSCSVSYTCRVENHEGIIYKKGTTPITCASDVDLSGSTLLVNDSNATWFGIFMWGDAHSLYWDYEVQDDMKSTFTADNYVISLPSNDELPSNAILKISETPYSVRDDDGYLYSVGRSELVVHDINGICSSPFGDDWTHAGGEEMNCVITDLENDVVKTEKVFSVLSASYTYMSPKVGSFIGCEVVLDMSVDNYCSVLTAKRHNAIIKDFYFKPNPTKLHNRKYKNSMIYIRDSHHVIVSNIIGFNASGMKNGDTKATSGYMLRMSNCSDVTVMDCRMNGYWGANAMDSVKNIHFERCHMNRLDVHDYFYNVTARACTFYHHAVQIGYGRGLAVFSQCNFYYSHVPDDSYPEAYGITLNLTYGRVFEGTLIVEDCNIYVKDAPDNTYNLIQMHFRPEATAITKHFKFPEIRCKNLHITSPNEDLDFAYVSIGGTRRARTSTEMPTHVYGETMDNDVKWVFKNRAFDWGENKGRPLTANVGDYLRICDTTLNEEGKTLFYDWRYYQCVQAGDMVFLTKPAKEMYNITVGTAKFQRVSDPNWKSRHAYEVGDTILVTTSNFYNPYVYECIESGTSNGYFPIHTSGTVLEGSNDPVSEPDLCWWTYVGTKSEWAKDFNTNTKYATGTRFVADGKIYEVITPVTSTNLPPFSTPWLETFEYGGGTLKYIGNEWNPKKWFAQGSYCIADTRVYQLSKHDGITSGVVPTMGNLYCVDGDLTWEYQGKVASTNEVDTLSDSSYEAWQPETHYEPNTLVKVANYVYEVQDLLTGSSELSVTDKGEYMDGSIPVYYHGEHPLTWRVAGNSYEEGDLISDNTFIVKCIQSGTTNSNNKWGPLESASWLEDGTYVDGTCIWKKLTPTKSDGAWRKGKTYYTVGSILLTSANGNFKAYEVLESKTGLEAPTNLVVDQAFLDGTVTLKYKGLNDSWLGNSRYSLGDVVKAGENQYKCAFDGRLKLPNKSVFENITTNLTKGCVFRFTSSVDVPTRSGDTDWTVLVNNCEGIEQSVKGLPTGKHFFGGTNTITPVILYK